MPVGINWSGTCLLNGVVPKDKQRPPTAYRASRRFAQLIEIWSPSFVGEMATSNPESTSPHAHKFLLFSQSKELYLTGGSSASHGQLIFTASSFGALMKAIMAFHLADLQPAC